MRSKNFCILYLLLFIPIFIIISCSSLGVVGNSKEAQIIVERIDNNDGELFITILGPGENYLSDSKVLGEAYFCTKRSGKYYITANYEIIEKKVEQKQRVIKEKTLFHAAEYEYYNHEYEVKTRFNSSTLEFNIKKENKILDKHLFYIECNPKSKSVKITKGDIETENVVININKSLSNAYQVLSKGIPEKSKIAIINIAANNKSEGEFIISELSILFVNSRKYNMVDRQSLEVIRNEQKFQMTGDVDDKSVVSIGKLLGANVVITGTIEGIGEKRRLRLKALDVRTAEILGMVSERI